MQGVVSFVCIGSNLGNPIGNCLRAIESISSLDDVEVLQRSSLYRTEPVGFPEQDPFVNCVIGAKTTLSAHFFLKSLQRIEDDMGRIRAEKWGPRTIDLDILFYGDLTIGDETLLIPHPELHKRRFVLVPLCEIAPDFIHPAFGVSVSELLDGLKDESSVELINDRSALI